MSEQTRDGMGGGMPRQSMSIHTRKITDSCRDKDCIEDLRVYLTRSSQQILDSCANVRVRCAEIIHSCVEVSPVAFDRNHFCIDVTFFYRILADAITNSCRPTSLSGLAVFSKRVVLCGEESRAHVFSSDGQSGGGIGCANRPVAVVEVLDPMVLSSKVREACDCGCGCETSAHIPETIRALFDEELVLSEGKRRLFVTLGQFSIIRLERDAQLVIPVLEYSIPDKECCDSAECCHEDPCEAFSRIPFPAGQFSPRECDGHGHGSNRGDDRGCGCRD